MKKTNLLFLLTVTCFIETYAQATGQLISGQQFTQNQYAVTRKEKNIGWLKTSMLRNGDEMTLTTESSLLLTFVCDFDARARAFNKFLNNVLVEAGVHRTLNGKTKLNNTLRLTGAKYQLVSSEESGAFNKVIRHTVTWLYFNEPVGVTEVFSEVYMQFLEIKKVAASTYHYALPDGGSMDYAYQSGKLVKIVAHTTWATVTFTLIP